MDNYKTINDLTKMRTEIDILDSLIIEFINRRIKLGIKIIEYKIVHRLPFTDHNREEDVVLNYTCSNNGPLLNKEAVGLAKAIIKLTKNKIKKDRRIK